MSSNDDFLGGYENKRDRERSEAKGNTGELCDRLSHLGVTPVERDFDFQGDEREGMPGPSGDLPAVPQPGAKVPQPDNKTSNLVDNEFLARLRQLQDLAKLPEFLVVWVHHLAHDIPRRIFNNKQSSLDFAKAFHRSNCLQTSYKPDAKEFIQPLEQSNREADRILGLVGEERQKEAGQ